MEGRKFAEYQNGTLGALSRISSTNHLHGAILVVLTQNCTGYKATLLSMNYSHNIKIRNTCKSCVAGE